MAASSDSFAKSHVQSRRRQSKSSSCSNYLCKFLVMVLVLILVPTFPSQPPEFVSHSIFKEFWELFHLLVIGIAISYGLFCRKSGVENQPRDDFSNVNLSGFLNVPPVFEDGAEKLSISDENVSLQNLGCFYSAEGKKVGFLRGGNEGRNVDQVGNEKSSQIRRLRCFQGENLLVVADGNCGLDEHKPLGLPVRSLRSRRAISNNCSEGSFGKVENFRGLVPLNLEKKFDEVSGPGPHHSEYLQPKPVRMEMSEESSDLGLSCHCRAHSGMEHLRSRSSRYPKSSERENSEVQKELNGYAVKVPSVPKSRGFSIGSSKELDNQRPSKEFFNDSTLSAMQHVLDREKKKNSDTLTSKAKPSRFAKVLSRGRSVRTIRSRVFASDEMKRKEVSSNQTEEIVDGKNDLFEAPTALVKKVKGGEVKYQNSEKAYPVLKETFPLLSQNNEGQDLVDTDSALLSEMGSESDSEPEDPPQPQGSLDEKKTELNHVAEDAELEGSEVDRKADEFIAKFREQMRLQKIASLKRN